MAVYNLYASALQERAKAFQEDEWSVIIKFAPTKLMNTELARRNERSQTILNDLYSILANVPAEVSLEEMQEIIGKCRKAIKMG